jgi:Ca2+-binding RTX toxin-like protein
MGQPTFGPRKWIEAFEVERVLGSDFDDVFLGPSGASDPVKLIGFHGRDDLRGGEGDDVLVGGAGPDTLRGRGGADTLEGWLGNDVLFGGSGPDILRGGP